MERQKQNDFENRQNSYHIAFALCFRSDETTWDITDNQGSVVESGDQAYSSNTTYDEIICLPPGICYSFNLYDSYGDG